ERRYIEHLGFITQRPGRRLPNQIVNRREKRRQGLAGSGGGGNESVPALLYRRPGLRLWLCRRRKLLQEPFAHRGMERLKRFHKRAASVPQMKRCVKGTTRTIHSHLASGIFLCATLRSLCVSVVKWLEKLRHRDTEIAQRTTEVISPTVVGKYLPVNAFGLQNGYTCRPMPKATRDYHPAKHTAAPDRARTTRRQIEIPKNAEQIELKLSGRVVKLTNLKKLFWPELKITKRDLIQYYADVAALLLPHLRDRA